MVTDEELEEMKPTLQALLGPLCDASGSFSWIDADGSRIQCTCIDPNLPCGDRFLCLKRPGKWKAMVRERLKI